MSFSGQVATFKVGSLKAVEQFRRGVVLKLFSSVILDTPVDTGRLRANWRTNVASPNLTTSDAKDPTGVGAINEVKNNSGDGTGKDISVYFSNSLPYAYRIEFEGWSKIKAPHGMVRRNVARIAFILKQNGKTL
jgi:hypothetical protein